MNPKVDDFISKATRWPDEISVLRSLLLDYDVVEELKWRQPCYTYDGNNMIIIAAFKDYFSLGFFKGALLKNEHGLLTAPGENSQAVRQLRFTSIDEIVQNEEIIRSTIQQAIEVEKSGRKIDFKEKTELVYPDELIEIFENDKEYKMSFEKLTPGRQRGYNLHFTAAKQATTRLSRMQECRNKVMAGKGKDDCTCGLSKRMPRCDGSHKMIKA